MTNEGLNKLIDWINCQQEKIIKLEIENISKDKTVSYVKKILLKSEIDKSKKASHFYLIKNINDLSIGIIQNGFSDLHWFLKKEYRGNGLMFNALKYHILPHIFNLYPDKKEQKITMDERYTPDTYEKSKKLALALGFIMTEETNDYEKHRHEINKGSKEFQENIKKYMALRTSQYILKREDCKKFNYT